MKIKRFDSTIASPSTIRMSKREADGDIPLMEGTTDCNLACSSDWCERDLRLFEVPPELEKDIMKGQEVHLLGSEKGLDAVLCTGDKTYSVKKVETSNTVCLVPPRGEWRGKKKKDEICNGNDNDSEERLVGTCPFFYELKQATPSFAKVEQALLSTVYRGINKESAYPPEPALLLTRQEVRALALASEAEVDAALKHLGAIEVNGYVRILSRDAQWDITKKLVNEIILGDLNYDGLADDDLKERLESWDDSVDYTLFTHTLSRLGEQFDGKWALERDKLAVAVAHVIFREDTKRFHNKENFIQTWELALPRGVRADEKLLRGVALLVAQNPGEAEAFYTYVPAAESGETVAERVATALSIKPKLSYNEIRPYLMLEDSGDKSKEGELLALHTNLVDGYYVKAT